MQKKITNHEFSGFIGLIGSPNVGKSTILNSIVGQKLSITTSKPQTTRNCITGIFTDGSHQMIFLDTPGIHSSKKVLNKIISKKAIKVIEETDLNLWIVEPLIKNSNFIPEKDLNILKILKKHSRKTIVLINKIDLINRNEILKNIKLYNQIIPSLDIVPISGLKKLNINSLINLIKKLLPNHPFYFQKNETTDLSEKFLISELVREQIFLKLYQEIPYSSAVEVENIERTKKCIKIYCKILVEQETQKIILIGKRGSLIKEIGINARKKIESLLGENIFLALHVKVIKEWTSKIKQLKKLGYL